MRVMKGVIAALERFGDFSGLRLNCDKRRFLLRGFWPDPVRQQMAELGCKADSSTRYLGIQLGVVSPEEAFAPALAKALARARSVAHLGLECGECGASPNMDSSYFCCSGQGVFPHPVCLLVFAVCVSGGT